MKILNELMPHEKFPNEKVFLPNRKFFLTQFTDKTLYLIRRTSETNQRCLKTNCVSIFIKIFLNLKIFLF